MLLNLPVEILEQIASHIKSDYESYFSFRNSCQYISTLPQADFRCSSIYAEFFEKIDLLCSLYFLNGRFLTYDEIGYRDTFSDAYIMFECFQLCPMKVQAEILIDYEPILRVFLDHLNICKESRTYFENALQQSNGK